MTQDEFDSLVTELDTQCAGLSTSKKMLNHPIYSKLLELGASALSLVLYRLQHGDNSRCLYGILRAAEKNGPTIPDCDIGNIEKVKNHWLQWGKEKGYIE